MVDSNKIVSVIVPVFNAEKYLRKCIDSILNQTYSNIELILVNDGSTDNSEAICREYSEKDCRCFCYNQENAGPDYARKSGVLKSAGMYLTFVDADDYVEPDMIEQFMSHFDEDDYDMVTSYITRFDDGGREWTTDAVPSGFVVCSSQKEIFENYFVTRYITGAYYGKIYRRELLSDYPFVENAVIGEDISGVLYALQRASKVLVIPETYYRYYWNSASISHAKYTERHLVSLKNYIEKRDELVEKGKVDNSFVVGYFAEYEMAVATAMARLGKRDLEACELLRNDLKKWWNDIRGSVNTPAYMKGCIGMFIIWPSLFLFLYRILYLITGR